MAQEVRMRPDTGAQLLQQRDVTGVARSEAFLVEKLNDSRWLARLDQLTDHAVVEVRHGLPLKRSAKYVTSQRMA